MYFATSNDAKSLLALDGNPIYSRLHQLCYEGRYRRGPRIVGLEIVGVHSLDRASRSISLKFRRMVPAYFTPARRASFSETASAAPTRIKASISSGSVWANETMNGC